MSRLHVNVEILRRESTLRIDGECDRFPLAILGPSGAGKTTLLECIAGLLRPTAGRLTWAERTFFDAVRGVHIAPERRRIGYVMQEGVLFPHLSVRDNVLFSVRQRRVPNRSGIRQEVDMLLGELGILHLVDRKPQSVSGGERTRIALARALASKPALVLLDEPFVGLDPTTREQTQRLLMRVLAEHRLPAIVVTHDRGEALQYAATTWVLLDGIIAQAGGPEEVVRRPASLDVAEFVGVENLLAGETRSGSAGVCRVRCGAFEIFAHGDIAPATPVYVCVRPEDVLLSRRDATSSARNRIMARVLRVQSRGAWRRVELEAGAGRSALRLDAQVTHDAQRELNIEVGRELVAQFKASAAHLLVRPRVRRHAS